MKLAILATLAALPLALAECPNSCSGHGQCGEFDSCTCHTNFQGADCSQRVCMFNWAWVSTANGDLNFDGNIFDATYYSPDYAFTAGHSENYLVTDAAPGGTWELWPTYGVGTAADEGHFYMECSNRGICDRDEGVCTCFAGYEGEACRRSTCPEDCSGHGTCQTSNQVFAAAGSSYGLWDAEMSRSCICDPGYTGIACADRQCPFGDDPLTFDEHSEVTWVDIYDTQVTVATLTHGDHTTNADHLSGYASFSYTDHYGETWETDLVAVQRYDGSGQSQATAVKAALEALPNSVLSSVDVTAGYCESAGLGSVAVSTGAPTFSATVPATVTDGMATNTYTITCDATAGDAYFLLGTSDDPTDVDAKVVLGPVAHNADATAIAAAFAVDTTDGIASATVTFGSGTTLCGGGLVTVTHVLAGSRTAFTVALHKDTLTKAATTVSDAATQFYRVPCPSTAGTGGEANCMSDAEHPMMVFSGATGGECVVSPTYGDIGSATLDDGTYTAFNLIKYPNCVRFRIRHSGSSGNVERVNANIAMVTSYGETNDQTLSATPVAATSVSALQVSDTATETVAVNQGTHVYPTSVTGTLVAADVFPSFSGTTVKLHSDYDWDPQPYRQFVVDATIELFCGATTSTEVSLGYYTVASVGNDGTTDCAGKACPTVTVDEVIIDNICSSTTHGLSSHVHIISNIVETPNYDHAMSDILPTSADSTPFLMPMGDLGGNDAGRAKATVTAVYDSYFFLDHHEGTVKLAAGSANDLDMDGEGTTENNECGDRGLCDRESGICMCFGGYTGDSCSLQHALSV